MLVSTMLFHILAKNQQQRHYIVNPRLKLPCRIDNRNLVFQVKKVGGIAPQLNDKKIKNFSILSSMEKVQRSKKKKK